MRIIPAVLSAAVVVAVASAPSNAADARWGDEGGGRNAAFASPYFYYVPSYAVPYGFRYFGDPAFPGCYFARRSGLHGTYLIPVC
jgi:hypothetical protein